jgi:hypothetical protein
MCVVANQDRRIAEIPLAGFTEGVIVEMMIRAGEIHQHSIGIYGKHLINADGWHNSI